MTEVILRESDLDEYVGRATHRERSLQQLLAHPDCRDPDHPGCIYCEPEMYDHDAD